MLNAVQFQWLVAHEPNLNNTFQELTDQSNPHGPNITRKSLVITCISVKRTVSYDIRLALIQYWHKVLHDHKSWAGSKKYKMCTFKHIDNIVDWDNLCTSSWCHIHIQSGLFIDVAWKRRKGVELWRNIKEDEEEQIFDVSFWPFCFKTITQTFQDKTRHYKTFYSMTWVYLLNKP